MTSIRTQLRHVPENHPGIRQALIFGSVASGHARPDSDLDIADHAELMRRHLFDAADFQPYVDRMLRERRQRWID